MLRGYLQREVHPEDHRRMNIDVTERGRAAAAAIRAGIVSVDDELATLVTAEQLAGLRAGLEALCAIRERLEDEAHAHTHSHSLWPEQEPTG